MENNYYELKMYSLVLYQLGAIHKGIQTQHVITEYSQTNPEQVEYKQWATKDKTTIILDVGGSNDMEDAIQQLFRNNIRSMGFREPDLYDKFTAVCFLVDERVWDKEKYPDPKYPLTDPPINKEVVDADLLKLLGTKENVFLRSFLRQYKRG